jgi:hypothetical protein
MHRVSMRPILLALALVGLLVPATVLARRDLAAACRADVARLCPGLSPGGGRIARCLKEHAEELSAPCKQAIADRRARGGRGPGGDGPGPAQGACRDDVARLCSDTLENREKLRTCMRAHVADLSDGCKKAISAWRRQRRGGEPAR